MWFWPTAGASIFKSRTIKISVLCTSIRINYLVHLLLIFLAIANLWFRDLFKFKGQNCQATPNHWTDQLPFFSQTLNPVANNTIDLIIRVHQQFVEKFIVTEGFQMSLELKFFLKWFGQHVQERNLNLSLWLVIPWLSFLILSDTSDNYGVKSGKFRWKS